MAQTFTFDADGSYLINQAPGVNGPDGVSLLFTITGTNSGVLAVNTAPPGAAVSLTNIPYLNGSLVAQSAGTAITGSGIVYVSNAVAANDLYLVLNWTSGSTVVLVATASIGGSGGGGSGEVPAADVTPGTFGANTGATGDYAVPDDFTVADVLTAASAAITGAATVGTTLANNGTSASLAQSATTATVNVGTGTGSGDSGLAVRGAAATLRNVQFQTAGNARWILRTDNVAESGADAGSNFAILARTDAGAAIDSPLTIARAAGGVATWARAVRFGAGALGTSPTAGIGYTTGAGGAQTQATDKSTTVVSNTITTAITMDAAQLDAGTAVSFTFTNSTIAATDQVVVTHQSAGTSGAYFCNAFPGAGSAVITVRNLTAGNLSEAIVLRVSVYKAVSA